MLDRVHRHPRTHVAYELQVGHRRFLIRLFLQLSAFLCALFLLTAAITDLGGETDERVPRREMYLSPSPPPNTSLYSSNNKTMGGNHPWA